MAIELPLNYHSSCHQTRTALLLGVCPTQPRIDGHAPFHTRRIA